MARRRKRKTSNPQEAQKTGKRTEPSTKKTNAANRGLIIANNKSKYDPAAQFLTRRGIETLVVQTLPEAIKLVTQARPQYVFLSFNLKDANVFKTSKLLSTTFKLHCIVFAEESDSRTAAQLSRAPFEFTMNSPISGPSMYMQIQKIIRQEEAKAKQKENLKKNRFSTNYGNQSEPIKISSSRSRELDKDGKWEKEGKDSQGRTRWNFKSENQSLDGKDGEFAYFGDVAPKKSESGEWEIPEDGELGFQNTPEESASSQPSLEEQAFSDDSDVSMFEEEAEEESEAPEMFQLEPDEKEEAHHEADEDEDPKFALNESEAKPSEGVHFQEKIQSKTKKKLYMPSKDPSFTTYEDEDETDYPKSTDIEFDASDDESENTSSSEPRFALSPVNEDDQQEPSKDAAASAVDQTSPTEVEASSYEKENEEEGAQAPIQTAEAFENFAKEEDHSTISDKSTPSLSAEELNAEESKSDEGSFLNESDEGKVPTEQAAVQNAQETAFNENPSDETGNTNDNTPEEDLSESGIALSNPSRVKEAKATKNAFEDVLDTQGPLENKIETVKSLRIFSLITKPFQGLVVVAIADTSGLEDQLADQIRDKLAKHLGLSKEQAEALDSFSMDTEEIDFRDWAIDESDFQVTTQHKADEVLCAFVPIKDIVAPLKESPESHMAAIPLSSVSSEVDLGYDAFLYFPINKKYIWYVGNGHSFSQKQLAKLTANNFHYIHIKKEAQREYLRYCIKVYILNSISNKVDLLKNAV